jgi:hypothetical protein
MDTQPDWDRLLEEARKEFNLEREREIVTSLVKKYREDFAKKRSLWQRLLDKLPFIIIWR